MEEMLEKVRQFAEAAHGEQRRKYAPEKYIEHPVRVMELCKLYDQSPAVLATALLHDVLEDTSVTRDEIARFLFNVMDGREAAKTIAMVVELTNVYTRENYPRLQRRKRKRKEAERLGTISSGAQTIKYADIIDNCRGISVDDPDFAPVFLKECKTALTAMTKGNARLREKALYTIQYEKIMLNDALINS